MEAKAALTERGPINLGAPVPARGWQALRRRLWLALSAAWAAVTGLAPHVLHHVGPLAGAALFAGVGSSLLFGAIGLIVAIPFLRRLHRHFQTWRAPAVAVAVFATVFSISTFVIGPQINGEDGDASDTPAGAPSAGKDGHAVHH